MNVTPPQTGENLCALCVSGMKYAVAPPRPAAPWPPNPYAGEREFGAGARRPHQTPQNLGVGGASQEGTLAETFSSSVVSQGHEELRWKLPWPSMYNCILLKQSEEAAWKKLEEFESSSPSPAWTATTGGPRSWLPRGG